MFGWHRYTGTRLEADLETQEPKGTFNPTWTFSHTGKRKANSTPKRFLYAPVDAL